MIHWTRMMGRRAAKLMVMPSNNSSAIVHHWSGKFPGRIGWLVGPSAMPKTKLRHWMPFALDNDAFGAWSSKRAWDENAWLDMLRSVQLSGLKPLWTLVPDVVADREATLRNWERYAPVQNGMSPADIPQDADVIFIGGTTEWKWQTLPMWAETGKRVHVGRVNEVERLHICERWSVESVDGTGWMRGSEHGRQCRDLQAWLEGRAIAHPELQMQ